MLPATDHLTIYQGETYRRVWEFRTGSVTGPLINLTGATARMHIKTEESATTITLDCSTMLTVGGAAGTVALVIPEASSAALADRTYVYDVEITYADTSRSYHVRGNARVHARRTA